MHNLERLRNLVDREIENMDLNSRQPAGLYIPVSYIMSNGGKRIRPVILLLASELFGDDIKPAVKLAAGIELFHNFTLIHDDIMDKADIRRGAPTVHIKWDENTAILSGDVMMVLAWEMISSAGTEKLPEILAVFNKTAAEVCEGQQLDMEYESVDKITQEQYLEMIRLKTSVLIGAAMKMGSLAGGASADAADLMYHCGVNLGLGFQLQDDLLDLYGKQEDFGKKQGGDILLNKKTFLLVKALEAAGGETADRLVYLMEKESSPEKKVSGIREIFDHLNVPVLTKEKADLFFNNALEKLSQVDIAHERKSYLEGFIIKVMNRNY